MDKARKKKNKLKIQGHKDLMGAKRKAYFESGGDISTWRGRASRFVDQKKKQNKNACRKNISREW